MRLEPRGGAVRRMRLTDRVLLTDGSEVTVTVSAPGFIVRVAHVPGQKPAETRRELARYCKQNGIIIKPVEYGGGTFSKLTGKPIPGSEPTPTAYQVMGDADALQALTTHRTVGEYHAAISIRVPVIASGNGEEKPRPASGSAFGKPATLTATSAALVRQADEAIRSTRKSWGLMSE